MSFTEAEKTEMAKRLEIVLEFQPRTADDYTDEEKIEAFNKLHKEALDHYNACRNNDRVRQLGRNLAFESLMTLLKPEGVSSNLFWEHFNELDELTRKIG